MPEPAGRLLAPPYLALRERLEQRLHALAALVARPSTHDLHGVVECLGVAQVPDLAERAQAQLRVAVAAQTGDQEDAAQLARLVEMEHRLGPTPVVGSHPRARKHRPGLLLAPAQVLHGYAPKLTLEHLRATLLVGRDRNDAALHAQAA